jgi:hypothetical protein
MSAHILKNVRVRHQDPKAQKRNRKLNFYQKNKADEMNPVWKTLVFSHLNLTGRHLGFPVNFNLCGLVP